MDEEERLPAPLDQTTIELYRERVRAVETKLEVITVKQIQQQDVVDKHGVLLDAIAKQITSNEMIAARIADRTEQHSKHIEHLQEREVDMAKLLETMKVQLSILRYVGGAIATFIIGYLLSHFIK